MPTFKEITETNVARCKKWHNSKEEWTTSDWAVAFAGEAGEVCDAVKKLRRIETGATSIGKITSREEAVAEIGKELADSFLYMNLLAHHLGLVLEDEIVKKFNEVSIKYGFEELL